MRIESICIVPMAAMGNVMSSFTAQNLGAGKQERVVKGYHTGYGIVLGFGIILCVILEFFYQPLIGMFLGEKGTALAMSTGTDYLRFIGWFFTFIGLKMITDGLLRGAGDMKESVYRGKPGQFEHPCHHGSYPGTGVWDCNGMVCSACWIGCQLRDFLPGIQDREVEKEGEIKNSPSFCVLSVNI